MAHNLRRCTEAHHASGVGASGAGRTRPTAPVGHTVGVAPAEPYDAQNFLRLLGIDVPLPEEDRDMVARLTVGHSLIAGTGYLWAPVVIAMADALCAFGVSRHWPDGARSFTTLNCSSQFLSSAQEEQEVTATASPLHLGRSTQVWDATVMNDTTERLMASYRCTQLILY
jgi:1,4-dihydroxy-2-naphthoyl-CoA hydrolase